MKVSQTRNRSLSFRLTWKLEWAKAAILSSVLYIARQTPGPLKSYTVNFSCLPWALVKTSSILPGPPTTTSVALYWSPNAWRPMTMAFVQPGTKRGMVLHMIGSRNTVPPRMLRIVPFGDSHIFFSLNSKTIHLICLNNKITVFHSETTRVYFP